MGKALRFTLIIFFLCRNLFLFSQNPAVVISSYYNDADPRDEWSELLVVADNTDMYGWNYQDNNATQTNWQPAITFNNPLFWKNMRAGTIIMIWHRQIGSTGIPHPSDANKADGYIEVSANDPTYFSGGNFGTAPLYAGPTLNIDDAGDLLVLTDATVTFIHALGHKAVPGAIWGALPLPKLNYKSGITDGEAVYVCPGASLDEYGTLPPQDGTTWTSGGTGAALTFGLPNTCTTSATANSDFWRSLRQPGWVNPVLTGTVNPANTLVTLNWNTSEDSFPADGTQGYLLLRNTSNIFGTPLDGHTYALGETLGGASVIAEIDSSQILSYTDSVTVPCPGGFYYRIYAFRYGTDNPNGNDYNVARGRAYNETAFGSVQVNGFPPIAPVSAASNRNNICANDTGTITLSVTGGSGTTLNWYTGSCGGTFLGASSGANDSITIPSPFVTTTYYARWESTCGISSCASITVNVMDSLPVSVSIIASSNPVCIGTSVTFTASPVNPGTAPAYQWKVNGANAGTNSNTYTYTPSNGDSVSVVLTSNVTCPSGNPDTSNIIVMMVSSGTLNVSVTISANHSAVCPGTIVTFTASPVNEGASPVYEWLVNGVSVQLGSSPVYTTNSLTGGESVVCRLTSSLTCVVANPVESMPLSLPAAPVPVVKLTDQAFLCAGEPSQLDAGPGFSAYLWQDGSTGRYFTAINPGVYRVTVTDSLGCTASDSVLLKICNVMIYIPDAFTPNGDGLNDEFKVVTSLEGITEFSMQVYNRWGEMVFESSDIHHGWNGIVNGKYAPPDSYVWKIIYQIPSQGTASASSTTLHGTVLLIR